MLLPTTTTVDRMGSCYQASYITIVLKCAPLEEAIIK